MHSNSETRLMTQIKVQEVVKYLLSFIVQDTVICFQVIWIFLFLKQSIVSAATSTAVVAVQQNLKRI